MGSWGKRPHLTPAGLPEGAVVACLCYQLGTNSETLVPMKQCVACGLNIETEVTLCRSCGTRQDQTESSGDCPPALEVVDKRRVDPSTGDIRPEAAAREEMFSTNSAERSVTGGGWLRRTLLVAGGIALLSILVNLFPALLGGSSGDWGAAKSACHNRVASLLKAPSTAKFTSSVTKSGTVENLFRVEGSVDSQNSFGGTVRSRFECVVDTSGSNPRATLNYLG